jgi:hypothetical protein
VYVTFSVVFCLPFLPFLLLKNNYTHLFFQLSPLSHTQDEDP